MVPRASALISFMTFIASMMQTLEFSSTLSPTLAKALSPGVALRDFDHPGSSHDIQWDIKHASRQCG